MCTACAKDVHGTRTACMCTACARHAHGMSSVWAYAPLLPFLTTAAGTMAIQSGLVPFGTMAGKRYMQGVRLFRRRCPARRRHRLTPTGRGGSAPTGVITSGGGSRPTQAADTTLGARYT
eukprot:scaffold5951_cov63-Phaeocystis_antarctica.AAC.1